MKTFDEVFRVLLQNGGNAISHSTQHDAIDYLNCVSKLTLHGGCETGHVFFSKILEKIQIKL